MNESTSPMAYRLESDKPFDEVADALEKLSPEYQFRVLAVHNVQETLAEKGFERGPYKIIEICNAGFANEALGKDTTVGLFMPCKFTVHTEGDKTIVNLGRPTMIASILPDSGLEEMAQKVETVLIEVMTKAV